MARKNDLVIVESPSKAKTIGKYLGPGYTVKASMGHLRDLPKSTMGVDLGSFEPEYIPVPGKENLIQELRDAAAFDHRFAFGDSTDNQSDQKQKEKQCTNAQRAVGEAKDGFAQVLRFAQHRAICNCGKCGGNADDKAFADQKNMFAFPDHGDPPCQ